MPKSKRDQKVSLTKTKKKGLQAKQQLVEDIRKNVGMYKNLFVFTTPNMRNTQLKALRDEWKADSRFFFGKNKVMSLGLGRKKSDELEEDLHKVSKVLKGQCGILLTNKPKEEVIEYFEKYIAYDHARSGFTATETVELPAGPLGDFSHSMEPQLRQLGLSTSLQRGVVTLTKEHTVCTKGKPLTSEQARILKLLDKKMAEFRVLLLCMWSKEGFVKLKDFKIDGNIKENQKEGTVSEEDDEAMEE